MTRQKSFKRLVRARMEKTGESYTAARTMLLDAAPDNGRSEPALATSDTAIRERTGRGWEEWFDLLDAWGATERPHKEIARWVAAQLAIHPLAWNAQAISASYERARGMRVVGQRAGGFATSVSRTVAVPADVLFDAFVDESARRRWLPDAQLRQRTATRPRSARFDWGDGERRMHVTLTAKDAGRTTATVEHARLSSASEVEQMKRYWRERLTALKTQLEADHA